MCVHRFNSRRTFACSSIASNVERVGNSRAVLAGASRRAATARLEVGGGVDALVVGALSERAGGAGNHLVGAKRNSAGLGNDALVVTAVVVVAGRLRRGSRRGGRGRLGVALKVTGVPVATRLALGRGAARGSRVVRDTAALARVPPPARGRASVVGGRRGRG